MPTAYSTNGHASGPPLPPQTVENIDLRYPGHLAAFDVRGYSRLMVQAVLESGEWNGSSGDAEISWYRSSDGQSPDGSAVATLTFDARQKPRVDPAGCSFLVAVIEAGDNQPTEARVKLICSGTPIGGAGSGAGGVVSLIALAEPVVF
jgi:hypothetical protein